MPRLAALSAPIHLPPSPASQRNTTLTSQPQHNHLTTQEALEAKDLQLLAALEIAGEEAAARASAEAQAASLKARVSLSSDQFAFI